MQTSPDPQPSTHNLQPKRDPQPQETYNIQPTTYNTPKRCHWPGNDALYIKYHDEEWGKEVHDDKLFFEFLILESAQAGLSWITILRRREGYRKAFANFDVLLNCF